MFLRLKFEENEFNLLNCKKAQEYKVFVKEGDRKTVENFPLHEKIAF